MAKRKRPTVAAEVPSDLLDAVHRVPWERPYLSVDALDDWQARFARLQAHRGYTAACAEPRSAPRSGGSRGPTSRRPSWRAASRRTSSPSVASIASYHSWEIPTAGRGAPGTRPGGSCIAGSSAFRQSRS